MTFWRELQNHATKNTKEKLCLLLHHLVRSFADTLEYEDCSFARVLEFKLRSFTGVTDFFFFIYFGRVLEFEVSSSGYEDYSFACVLEFKARSFASVLELNHGSFTSVLEFKVSIFLIYFFGFLLVF